MTSDKDGLKVCAAMVAGCASPNPVPPISTLQDLGRGLLTWQAYRFLVVICQLHDSYFVFLFASQNADLAS